MDSKVLGIQSAVLEIGFRFGKVNGRNFLLERNDVISARTRSLKKMKALKRSGFDA